MKTFSLALVFVCALVAVARAQQPGCPGGNCPPVNYTYQHGLLWKKSWAYQRGTTRATFSRSLLGKVRYTYSR